MEPIFYPEDVKSASWERMLRAYKNIDASKKGEATGKQPGDQTRKALPSSFNRVHERKVVSKEFRSSKQDT